MQIQWFYKVIFLAAVTAQVNSECSEEKLNDAQIAFKDCMDEKKATLLQPMTGDQVQEMICSGLQDLSTGCKVAVTQFSVCRGREYVDNLVAIHLNAMSEVLAPFYPDVDLKSCPVFNTPAPIVVQVDQKEDVFADPEPKPEPEYEPVVGTNSATLLTRPVSVLLMVATMLRLAL